METTHLLCEVHFNPFIGEVLQDACSANARADIQIHFYHQSQNPFIKANVKKEISPYGAKKLLEDKVSSISPNVLSKGSYLCCFARH